MHHPNDCVLFRNQIAIFFKRKHDNPFSHQILQVKSSHGYGEQKNVGDSKQIIY